MRSRHPQAAEGGATPAAQCTVNQKRLAATRLAVDPDRPAHQLDELLADRQAEAGSAIAARRRAVCLDEAGEQRIAHLGRDADAGVGDLDAQLDGAARQRAMRDAEGDRPQMGELDRVGDQIEQHWRSLPGSPRR